MSNCRACGTHIIWARTAVNDRPIPLDPQPTDDGNVILEYGAGDTGSPTAHVIGKNGLPIQLAHLADAPRYFPHHASCTKWATP